MAVFNEVTIAYNGKDYTFTPSLKLLRRIEQGDGTGPVSIVSLINEASRGKPQLSLMAWLVATVMQHAGARVDEEQLYADLMASGEDGLNLYLSVLAAISPSAGDPGNDQAPT